MFYLLLLLIPLVNSQFNPNPSFGSCNDAASGCETQPALCGMQEIARTYCMKTCRLCSGQPAPSPLPYPSVFPNPGGFSQTTQQVPFPQQGFGNNNFGNDVPQINPKFVETHGPTTAKSLESWNQDLNDLNLPETGGDEGANTA